MLKKFTVSGSVLVFLGALFWSLNAPLVKFIELDALLTCGLRSLIAGLFLLPFLRPSKLRWSPWMAVYLVAYTCLCVGIVLALRRTSAAIAIGMQYASIVWLFLVSSIAARKLDRNHLLPVILIATGVIIFMLSGISGSTMTGNLIALTESISFAFMTVGAKKSAGTNPLGLTALANLFTGLFVFLFLPPQFTDLGTLNGQEWLIILILGIVQIGLGYALYNMGVGRVSPQKASVIALWEMILGPVWTAIFLHEYPGLLVCVGFVIIIAGILADARADAAPGSDAAAINSISTAGSVLTGKNNAK